MAVHPRKHGLAGRDHWPGLRSRRGRLLGPDRHAEPGSTDESWFENTWAAYRSAAVFQRDHADSLRPYEIYRDEGK